MSEEHPVAPWPAGMGTPFRWGIIGTGSIASAFAQDLTLLADAQVVAVGSRATPTAEAFAARHAVPSAYGSYQELVGDPQVDAVYVATPHPGHHDATVLAVQAGKAVLCEKPFMINAAQAQHVITLAAQRGVFVMEAMWTRFLPHMVAIRELLDAGALGTIRTVQADHGQWFPDDPEHRLLNPQLGGGALLDLGVYPVSFASFVLGAPERVCAVSDPAFTGVDGQTSMLFRYSGGAHAVLTTTLWGSGPNRASIVGSDARIEIDPTWYRQTSFTVLGRDDRVIDRYSVPALGLGLRYQAEEVARCVRAGLTESPLMPAAESVSIMAIMDEVRTQIHLSYPGE